jgi:hypothetical protein
MVQPQNCPSLVQETLSFLKLDGDSSIKIAVDPAATG